MGHASVPGQVPDPFAIPPQDDGAPGWMVRALATRGISRRRFLQWCSAMTAAMALPKDYAPRVVRALETGKKPVMVWLEFQDCAGNTESMLRTTHPSIEDVVLDVLSLEYHETIMAGAGKQAEEVLERVRRENKGEYIVIIEGAIPTAEGGIYCTIGGKTALQIAQEMTADAALTIAVGVFPKPVFDAVNPAIERTYSFLDVEPVEPDVPVGDAMTNDAVLEGEGSE